MSRERLTAAQAELLAEIRTVGGLYVHRHMRYGRTIEALERKGFVICDERSFGSYSQFGNDHFVATDEAAPCDESS